MMGSRAMGFALAAGAFGHLLGANGSEAPVERKREPQQRRNDCDRDARDAAEFERANGILLKNASAPVPEWIAIVEARKARKAANFLKQKKARA